MVFERIEFWRRRRLYHRIRKNGAKTYAEIKSAHRDWSDAQICRERLSAFPGYPEGEFDRVCKRVEGSGQDLTVEHLMVSVIFFEAR